MLPRRGNVADIDASNSRLSAKTIDKSNLLQLLYKISSFAGNRNACMIVAMCNDNEKKEREREEKRRRGKKKEREKKERRKKKAHT